MFKKVLFVIAALSLAASCSMPTEQRPSLAEAVETITGVDVPDIFPPTPTLAPTPTAAPPTFVVRMPNGVSFKMPEPQNEILVEDVLLVFPNQIVVLETDNLILDTPGKEIHIFMDIDPDAAPTPFQVKRLDAQSQIHRWIYRLDHPPGPEEAVVAGVGVIQLTCGNCPAGVYFLGQYMGVFFEPDDDEDL